jgi:hypothetical protein
MSESDLERAVALARTTVGADEGIPATTFPVRRLDRASTYVLVQLGPPGRPGWVVAVDVDRDEVMTWAANAAGGPTVPMPEPSTSPSTESEWVWAPSRSSPSPLYPLLRLVDAGGERFVDLAGNVSPGLRDGRG